MLLPFGCCLQAEVVHCVLDESGFSAVTVQPIVHAVEHALQTLAVEFVHVPGERCQAAVNGVIHLLVRFVLDLRECGSPRIGRVDRVLPACLRVNGRFVEDQGNIAEVAVLHVRPRDRDAGHGRAAQREELLQLLFRQVVDGEQRALLLHRIFRGKLDNVRCFCYGGLRRRSRVRFGRRRGGPVFTGHRLDLRNAFFIYICSLDPYLVPFRINDRFRQEVRAVDFLFYYNEWRLIIH